MPHGRVLGGGHEDSPADLLHAAREAIAHRDYRKSVVLTRKANLLWSKTADSSSEYADSLVLCALAELGAEWRQQGDGASDAHVFHAWEKRSTDLLAQALELVGIGPHSKALALELQSVQPSYQQRAQDFRNRANEIHAKLVEEILPPKSTPGAIPAHRVGVPTPPSLVKRVEPAYVIPAIVLKVTGDVVLKLIVEPDGTASSGQVDGAFLGWGLDEQAAKAVKEWKFRPGLIGDTPVPVEVKAQVSFRLI